MLEAGSTSTFDVGLGDISIIPWYRGTRTLILEQLAILPFMRFYYSIAACASYLTSRHCKMADSENNLSMSEEHEDCYR